VENRINDFRLLIAIPCYNERENIVALLDELAQLKQAWNVLVVDDGSTDGTGAVAGPLARVLRIDSNMGIGAAIGKALRVAWEEGYDYCLQLDGDGQHPPAEIFEMLRFQRDHPVDIVVGSRFGTRDTFRSTWERRLGIRLIRGALWALFGLNVRDPTSGFRLFNRRAIAFFSTPPLPPSMEPVSLAQAAQAGLAIAEVSVHMRPRRHGKSSIAGVKKMTYVLRVVSDLLSTRLRATAADGGPAPTGESR
jgi:glycosyltransferase involved in cell wall biosynthesis